MLHTMWFRLISETHMLYRKWDEDGRVFCEWIYTLLIRQDALAEREKSQALGERVREEEREGEGKRERERERKVIRKGRVISHFQDTDINDIPRQAAVTQQKNLQLSTPWRVLFAWDIQSACSFSWCRLTICPCWSKGADALYQLVYFCQHVLGENAILYNRKHIPDRKQVMFSFCSAL